MGYWKSERGKEERWQQKRNRLNVKKGEISAIEAWKKAIFGVFWNTYNILTLCRLHVIIFNKV